jgi:predicted RNase H-like HicB family nuclease
MSDEKNPDVNEESSVNTEQVEDKQTNRTFSQSDFDRAKADIEKKFKTRYEDYDQIKDGFLELKKWKEQKEQEAMTEQEKIANIIKNTTSENENLKQEKDNLLKQIMKKDVLLDKKYSGLPTVYKMAVQGDSPEEVTESADNMLNAYYEDMKAAGKPIENVSIPNDLKAQATQQNVSPKDFKQQVNDMLKNKINALK